MEEFIYTILTILLVIAISIMFGLNLCTNEYKPVDTTSTQLLNTN